MNKYFERTLGDNKKIKTPKLKDGTPLLTNFKRLCYKYENWINPELHKKKEKK